MGFGKLQVNVKDETPMEQGEESLAFKNGDSGTIVLRPENETASGKGLIRLMATKITGKPVLIATEPITKGEKRHFEYEMPASGKVFFEFVGSVPAAKVDIRQSEHGYVAMFAVPRGFLEIDLRVGAALNGDVEIRLSGTGLRGLQAVSRKYLFTPAKAETTMTDDIPTEARLNPQHWGFVEIR